MLHDIRLKRCFQYHLRGMSRAAAIYLAIFLLADIVLPAVIFLFIGQRIISNGSTFQISFGSQSGSFAFLFSTMIFLFAGGCASFREDFNYLLAMNNTRRNQFLSSVLLLVTASIVFAICGIPVRFLEVAVESLVNQEAFSVNLTGFLGNYFDGSTAGGYAVMLAEYAAIFLSAYAFGHLAGILSYRFNRLFIIPFWICFGTSFIFVPILATGNKVFQAFIIWFLGIGTANPALSLTEHLLAIAFILLAITALFNRKLPQAA